MDCLGGWWFPPNYFQIVSDFPTQRNKWLNSGQIKAFPPAASQPLRETHLDTIMTLLQSCHCCYFFKHWTTEVMFLNQFPLKSVGWLPQTSITFGLKSHKKTTNKNPLSTRERGSPLIPKGRTPKSYEVAQGYCTL